MPEWLKSILPAEKSPLNRSMMRAVFDSLIALLCGAGSAAVLYLMALPTLKDFTWAGLVQAGVGAAGVFVVSALSKYRSAAKDPSIQLVVDTAVQLVTTQIVDKTPPAQRDQIKSVVDGVLNKPSS